MELVERTQQLVGVVGYDETGKRTTIAICTTDEIKKTSQVVFSSWPQTTIVRLFDVTLSVAEQDIEYTREDLAAIE